MLKASFVMMPTGINRKGLKQGASIMLTPTKLTKQDLHGEREFEQEEVENPVVISPVQKSKKKKRATEDQTGLGGYNYDLEPGEQTSGFVSNSDLERDHQKAAY